MTKREQAKLLEPVAIVPAILSQSLADLRQKLAALGPWAKRVHVDIADGQFVANGTLTYTEMAPFLADSNLALELHLMVADPWPVVEAAAAARLHRILLHVETGIRPPEIFQKLASGLPLGLVFNLQSGWGEWQSELPRLPAVMLMAIEAGWQGQPFVPEVLEKLRLLTELAPEANRIIDGGVNEQTLPSLVRNGATELIVGSSFWKKPDQKTTFYELCALASASQGHEAN